MKAKKKLEQPKQLAINFNSPISDLQNQLTKATVKKMEKEIDELVLLDKIRRTSEEVIRLKMSLQTLREAKENYIALIGYLEKEITKLKNE